MCYLVCETDVAVSTSGSRRVPLPWVESRLLSGRLQGQRPERRCQAEGTSLWALHATNKIYILRAVAFDVATK